MPAPLPERLPGSEGDAPSSRGQQTRELILQTALQLFRERGYEATTMRLIAAEAGVSVGNAYYYFPSKQHLVQAYYDASQERHVAAARPVLERETSFEARLLGVLRARLETMEPEKGFAVDFFRSAADPRSPLSPFSAESAPARQVAVSVYVEVVEGAHGLKVPADLRAVLPELLWLYSMGVVLFWVHDDSPASARTRALVEGTVPVVARLVGLARYRLLRGTVSDLVRLLGELRAAPG